MKYFSSTTSQLVAAIIMVLTAMSCSKSNETEDSRDSVSGLWRCELDLKQDSVKLPFFLEIIPSDSGYKSAIHNGDEAIVTNDVIIVGDTIRIVSAYFQSEIVAKMNRNTMEGYWQDHSRSGNYRLPFSAKYNLTERFSFDSLLTTGMDGKWAVTFSPGTENSYPAIGLFDTDVNSMKGTFITETGDYRFLEGGFDGQNLKLSAFDGSHAFLFLGRMEGDTLKGWFYSGQHHKEPFVAYRDSSATLTSPYVMTQLSSPDARVQFKGISTNGDTISYPSTELSDKPFLLQIMGSWCPNCLDESVFLTQVYPDIKALNIPIYALAFERGDYKSSVAGLKKLEQNLELPYEILYAGEASKKSAGEALPFLDGVKSYPTLLYVLPGGKIHRIHTGFYGPGTGEYYQKQSREMMEDIKNLHQLSQKQ